MKFEEFTLEQKDTYTKVHDLEEELMRSIDPATFVLNPKTLAIRYQIEKLQEKCNHIYENGTCIVCGKEEEE